MAKNWRINTFGTYIGDIKSYLNRHPGKVILALALFWVLLFTILVVFVHRLSGSDDYVFQEQIKPYPTLWSWLDYRYHTWSGRIFSESFMYIFSPLPLIFWKFISVTLYALYVFYAYAIYKLFAKKHSTLHSVISLSLICAVPYLMNSYSFYDSTLWVTGGMAYFWIMVFGIIGLFPILYLAVKNKLPRWYHSVFGIIATIIACSSQEQIGAVIVAITAIILGVLTYRYARKSLSTAVFLFVAMYLTLSIVSLIISFTAPGNDARVDAEIIRWLADFKLVPYELRISYSIRWLLDALVNHTGFLLPILWFGIASLIYQQKEKCVWWQYLTIASFSGIALTTLLRGYQPFATLLNFHAQWGLPSFSVKSNMLVLFWILVLIATLLAPLLLTRKPIGWSLFILFGGALTSTAVVTLSPTMYASGWRTLYVPSMLIASMIVLICIFLLRTTNKYEYTWPFIGSIFFLSITQFMYLLLRVSG